MRTNVLSYCSIVALQFLNDKCSIIIFDPSLLGPSLSFDQRKWVWHGSVNSLCRVSGWLRKREEKTLGNNRFYMVIKRTTGHFRRAIYTITFGWKIRLGSQPKGNEIIWNFIDKIRCAMKSSKQVFVSHFGYKNSRYTHNPHRIKWLIVVIYYTVHYGETSEYGIFAEFRAYLPKCIELELEACNCVSAKTARNCEK